MDIATLDLALAVATVNEDGLAFRPASSEPFRIYGVFRENEQYVRVPMEPRENTSIRVAELAKHTAGGRIRFVTNSRRIAIHAIFPSITRMPHMAFTGIFGFDLYANGKYIKTFTPPFDITDEYKSVYTFDTAEERVITINMPLYNPLSEVYIGIDEGSSLSTAPDYSIECPIVFYGSSITQGGCASRPGSCYPSIVARALDANHINLGFSGSAKGEVAIREYIASLDMSAFVLDYDHNAKDEEELRETHAPLFRAVRTAHPDIPIIIMSRPKTVLSDSEERRRKVCLETYEQAVAAGDANVYFIDGRDLMPEVGLEGTVDSTHPTDLGFYSMARVLTPVLRKILKGI